MAIDSRDKRASAIGVGLPWRVYPNPDGLALDQGDRQQVSLLYRGILASRSAGTPTFPGDSLPTYELIYANQSVFPSEVLDAMGRFLRAATGFDERAVVEWHRDSRPNIDRGGTIIWYRHLGRTLEAESGAGRNGVKANMQIEVNITSRGFKDGDQRDKILMRRNLALSYLIENAYTGRQLHEDYDPAEDGNPPVPKRKTAIPFGEAWKRRKGDVGAVVGVVSSGGTMTSADVSAPDKPRTEQGYIEQRLVISVPIVLRVTLDRFKEPAAPPPGRRYAPIPSGAPMRANQSVTIDEVLDAVSGLLMAATGFQERAVIEWHRDQRPDLTMMQYGSSVVWFRHVKRTNDTESGAGRHGMWTELDLEVNVTTRQMLDGDMRDREIIRSHLGLAYAIDNAYWGRMLHDHYAPAVGLDAPQPVRDKYLSDTEKSLRRLNNPSVPSGVVSVGTMAAAELPAPDRPRAEQGYIESRIGIRIPIVLRLTLTPDPDLEEDEDQTV